MAKNEFDSDFDLEKELGFDPKEFLDSDEGENFDLSQFDESELGIDLNDQAPAEESFDDFDINSLDLGLDTDPADAPDMEFSDRDFLDHEEFHGSFESDPGAYDIPESLYEEPGQISDNADQTAPYGEDPSYGEDPGEDAYTGGEDYSGEAYGNENYGGDDYDEDPAESQESYEAPYEPEDDDLLRRSRQEPEYDEDDEDLDPDAPRYDPEDQEDQDPEPQARKSHRRERTPRPRKEKKPRKEKPEKLGPSFFEKFVGLYFAPILAESSGQSYDPDAPDAPRRRKRSKSRIFKEVYLPPLILVVALILVLTCLVGSLSHAFQRKKINDEIAMQESVAEQHELDQQKAEYNSIMQQADIMAQGYDYDGAIKLMESYSGIAEAPQEMLAKKAEYAQIQAQMTEFKDPSVIPNLSFHVLIAEPAQAFADKEWGGMYNKNFVTIDEFQKILESLYQSGHVLVDFDSFIDRQVGVDGRESFFVKPIMLPAGKKPVMITETMVNYFNYMIDDDEDGPDGFASRLVVDGNGDIKAELVDAKGQSKIGNYDLVPILEDFIRQHPDFSYRGARATLAVTGSEGIFGYRINTANISDPKLGQAYYDKEVADAKVLVEALREKGYTLASYTYSNKDYNQLSVKQITKEMQDWKSQVTPVMGDVDVIVFARDSDINDYTGNKYSVLSDNGFRIFVGKGDKPSAEVNQTYIHQKRLIVSGNTIQWKSEQFKGMFDAAAIKNPIRGDVPNG